MQQVFLSYRRSDTANQATELKLILERTLPGVPVFLDTASINPGERWRDRLTTTLEESSVVVALIGPHWRFEPDGTDRFQHPHDWVLQEVTYGLTQKKGRFIPVFIDTNAKDACRNLPASLSDLPLIHGLELTYGPQWARNSNLLALQIASLTGATRIAGAIEYPAPSELKAITPRLSEAEFDERRLKLPELEDWVFLHGRFTTPDGVVDGTELTRSFTFNNFRRAFEFMVRVSELAESRPHHPVWTNSWNQVDVRLRTFDAHHRVTWYDVEMAAAMHKIAEAVKAEKKIKWPVRPRSD